MSNQLPQPPKDDERLVVGVDYSNGKDYAALTIKDGETVYWYVGNEAEAILSLIGQRELEARQQQWAADRSQFIGHEIWTKQEVLGAFTKSWAELQQLKED